MRDKSIIERLAVFVGIGVVLTLLLSGSPQIAWELENLGWKNVLGSMGARVQDTVRQIVSRTMIMKVDLN